MNPVCPQCASASTRRRSRAKTLGHRIMYLFNMFPWECLTCQKKFFDSRRYSRTKRNAAGEVYTGTEATPAVQPGSEEGYQP